MCRPAFRFEQEPTDVLRATLRQLVANGGDRTVIAGIRNELNDRALHVRRADGWPTALDDPIDDGLPKW